MYIFIRVEKGMRVRKVARSSQILRSPDKDSVRE